MPDQSDNPAPDPRSPAPSTAGKSPEETGGKPPAPAPLAEPLSLVPRARSATKEPAAPVSSAEGPPASFNDFVNWMKMFSTAMETAPPPEPQKPGAKLQRSTLPKTQRKFQRFDKEPGAAETPGDAAGVEGAPVPQPARNPAVTEGESATVEADRPGPYSGQPVPIALTGGASARRPKPTAERRPYFYLVLQVGAVILLALAFLLGRASVPKPTVVPINAAPAAPTLAADGSTVQVLSPEAAKMVDEAMALEQDRKFDEAADLLVKAQKNHPHIQDLDFRLALLAMENNDFTKALPLLNLSISQNEQVAAAYKLRGTILNRKGGGNRGMNDFENATLVDPFTAENFHFWGEALRRLGKPQAALVKLQQAIDRLREPALEAQYRLKIRLTQIELGREQDFAAEMAKELAEKPPAADWLLTAAAIELHRNNFPAAAGYLDKAAMYMDKEIFTMRMRDYFFYTYRTEPSLARFFDFTKTAAPTPAPTSDEKAPGSVAPDAPDAASMLRGAPVPAPAALPTGTP